MSHVISTRINDELFAELAEVAETRKRKLSEILAEAVNYYVQHCAEYKIALERLNTSTDEIISEKEMLSRLGWDD